MKFDYVDVPAELASVAAEWREKMIEAAAESSEEMMNKYLEEGELSEEEIAGLRARTLACGNSADAVVPRSRTRVFSACWMR